MNRASRQMRTAPAQFQTREAENGEPVIEGYFAVFNSNYVIWDGATESVAPGAFTDTLSNDIRALIDHESRLVLGRNKAGTLELKEDSRGLWGVIKVNREDVDAMNLYSRIQRGDVDQCSFGFEIQEEEFSQDGDKVHWTIKKVNLYEVSVVTFPAYEETGVTARKNQLEEIQKRRTAQWREEVRKRLKGDLQDGVKSTVAS